MSSTNCFAEKERKKVSNEYHLLFGIIGEVIFLE